MTRARVEPGQNPWWALEEKAQVAAALDGKARLVRPGAKEADEVKMEVLDGLSV